VIIVLRAIAHLDADNTKRKYAVKSSHLQSGTIPGLESSKDLEQKMFMISEHEGKEKKAVSEFSEKTSMVD
jgi:hypothetical protein